MHIHRSISKNFKMFLKSLTILSFLTIVPSYGQVDERFRPQIHFSIASNWINDPNGMVYLDGEYHLHYQYNPDDSVWGPMHWGHSVSRDLITWTDLPIALYPDPLGQIFSGSAVVDFDNSTGFQEEAGNPAMVAIFTHAGSSQMQSIAYSLDEGRTFTKFEGNPVIPNPGINDFRDPKVIRYENTWVLVLAAGNKVMFYSSPDLKNWEFASEFGADPEQGSHAGVWECPDLFPIVYGGETVWVLIVSINPGGPNGGSATQYFVGGFDGTTFTSPQIEPLWMDWGVDNYAAVSFFNEPSGRAVNMGWMNNWDYANSLPTIGWRGQMTLPRVMDLILINGQLRLTSNPAPEVRGLWNNDTYQTLPNQVVGPDEVLVIPTDGHTLLHTEFTLDTRTMGIGASFAICFLNGLGEEVCTGFDKGREKPIFLNREDSGDVGFNPSFSRRISAERERAATNEIKFEIYWDVSAVEVFVDGGLTAMTALYYPGEPYTMLEVRHHAGGNPGSELVISSAEIRALHTMSEIPRSG